jgi:WD40 repeat protein
MKSTLLFLWVLLLLLVSLPVTGQQTTSDNLQPISPENADQVQQITMLGRGGIHEFVWSPDSTRLAAIGPNGVWLYDATAWTSPPILLGDTLYYAWLGAFDPTGRLLITTDRNGWRLWDVEANRLIRTVARTRQAGVETMAISPDGRLLATGGSTDFRSAGLIQLWEVNTGRELAYLRVENAYQSVKRIAFSRDGQELLVAPEFAPLYRYNVDEFLAQTSTTIPSPEQELGTGAIKTAYTLDGQATALYVAETTDNYRRFELRRYPDNSILVTVSKDDWYSVTTMDYNFEAGLLAASGEMGQIELYSLETGELVRILPGHTTTIAVSFSPSGELMDERSKSGISLLELNRSLLICTQGLGTL